MKRRNFLKLSSGATIGLGINTDGLASEYLDWLAPAPNCTQVSDRVLVIIRLAGANDGLNTLVPVAQYDTYASLRPTIKLNLAGTGALINLDGTLAAANQLGLHPSMIGFKSLYDSGKLNIVQNIGYQDTNQSHFTSEIIMSCGKDGTTVSQAKYGFIGKYLNSIYPNLSGNPQPFMQDPLALHFGSINPAIGFIHDQGTSEYNMSPLEGTLYNQLRIASPQYSEYNDALNYIRFVESGMDKYFNRVETVFKNGSNSTTTYPNSDLARQLKTIARMIKGGSKTKIFQVTLAGFDTHGSQVVGGATHMGTHANLLQMLSSSMSSFMTDLAALGLDERVMTVTFSEFGRKARENGGLGTDHGNIAPLFVIGKHVSPGVVGTPPNLNNVHGGTDGRFFETEMQYDYRRVYTTLLQDWLGAANSSIQAAELETFQSQKLNLVSTSQNAYPDCLATSGIDCATSPSSVIKANLVAEIAGWSYYSFPNSIDQYVFGIEKFPSGIGANTNPFDVNIDITEILCTTHQYKHYIKSQGSEAMLAAGKYFNFSIISTLKPNGFVNIRWFIEDQLLNDLSSAAATFQSANGSSFLSPILYLKKTKTKLTLPENFRTDGLGLYYAVNSMQISETGILNQRKYIQFDSVTKIDGTGGGAFIRASSKPSNDSNYNIPAPITSNKGRVRFNTLTNTFEGYNGFEWSPLH
ncbi:DUF1501 domain-containing protein [Lacihabitans soyangensis]|uniref:DUF1501 domain-containing protein n=1 Tax=Lacihabitans soyangensis TaxID=869394 RepID=A0AAE3KSU5_9BACT|nr:DUF1501 domain-containing protein [Lacihabitans soyangensis]MCP9763717.1 DUF1501 domain-containing protein [Lacihabitans soyangensis]